MKNYTKIGQIDIYNILKPQYVTVHPLLTSEQFRPKSFLGKLTETRDQLNLDVNTSVIFVSIYFVVLVLVFQLFFSFSFVSVLQYFFVLVLVLPVIFKF